ncbi:hypothetical protein WPS_27710 [Vulcanimicrobium alpinum]|uniref:Uncharacterized protein n=1 Tax=Vulcanimicrobium alpinum TaxID=3016050 RepID=A0AAN1XYY5_UNVUL|nr:hypothetical protein [Vulcanimicrobium alpinum]BDE07495.1 hypothetical protein WPS_27710 [Vulcanimicrobium alpinum]
MPRTGIRLSGDAVFRVSGLLSEPNRDLYREMAARLSPANRPAPVYEARVPEEAPRDGSRDASCERPGLYEDDITEERQITPVPRDVLAASLVLDPDIA